MYMYEQRETRVALVVGNDYGTNGQFPVRITLQYTIYRYIIISQTL